MTISQNAMVAGAATMQQLASMPAAVDAAYDQSYNSVYARETNRYNAIQAKLAIEGNIAAAGQNKILNDLEIQVQQAQEAAQARVAAAAAGVEGASVQQSIDQATVIGDRNRSQNKRTFEQEVEGLLGGIGVLEASIHAEDRRDYSDISAVLLGGLSGINLDTARAMDFGSTTTKPTTPPTSQRKNYALPVGGRSNKK